MRFDCVCSRPAVSTIATSWPRARAASTASKATAAGSAPRGAPTKSAPARSRPDLELLLGGRAERVGRADEHRATVLAQLLRELPDRRRLAGAVHADDEDRRSGFAVERERRRLAEQRLDLLDERVLERARLRRAPRAAARAPRSRARRRRCGSAPPRAAPTPRRRRSRRRRTRARAVSARRLFASDSRMRPKKPVRSGSSAAVGSSPRSSAQV